jgi:hypothetical protein
MYLHVAPSEESWEATNPRLDFVAQAWTTVPI